MFSSKFICERWIQRRPQAVVGVWRNPVGTISTNRSPSPSQLSHRGWRFIFRSRFTEYSGRYGSERRTVWWGTGISFPLTPSHDVRLRLSATSPLHSHITHFYFNKGSLFKISCSAFCSRKVITNLLKVLNSSFNPLSLWYFMGQLRWYSFDFQLLFPVASALISSCGETQTRRSELKFMDIRAKTRHLSELVCGGEWCWLSWGDLGCRVLLRERRGFPSVTFRCSRDSAQLLVLISRL